MEAKGNAQLQELNQTLAAKRQDFRGIRKVAEEMGYKRSQFNVPIQRRLLHGHFGKIYSIAWGPDSRHVLTAAQDGKLILWDAIAGFKRFSFNLDSSWVLACAYSPDGKLGASGGLDNVCSVFKIPGEDEQFSMEKVTQAKAAFQLSGHEGYISDIKFVGNKIVTGSGDSTVMLWDCNAKQSISEYTAHTADVSALAVDPDGSVVVSGGLDCSAKVWDLRTHRPVMTYNGHDSDINAIEFFPGGKAFVTGSEDASCQFFDMRSGRLMAKYTSDTIQQGCNSVTFSKSGRLLISAHDQRVLFWDTLTQELIFDSDLNHDNHVSRVAVSPDGTALCSGSWDCTVRISNMVR